MSVRAIVIVCVSSLRYVV